MGRPSNGFRLMLLVVVALAGAAINSVAAQDGGASKGTGPSYFDPKNFNPSMAIVMVVLITAFFLLGFFSVYLRRCAGPPLGGPDDEYARARRTTAGGGGIAFVAASRSSRRVLGLDRDVLDSFPTMAYADVREHKAGKGELECAVCLSEFDDDETLRLLPRCAHAFHVDCIDAWLASHVTCPVCRAVLAPDAAAEVVLPAPAPAPAADAVSAATIEHEQGGVHVPAAAPPQQPAPETAATPEQVVVVVVPADEETEEERIRREEAAELVRIGSVKRALRSKSGRRRAQFPRSHTTGHSLAAPVQAAADSTERFTLRLPEHVFQEAVAASRLRRSASVQAFWTTRRGRVSGRSVRLGGQSSRWPSVSGLARTLSSRLPAWGSARRGEATDSPSNVAGDGKTAEQCDGRGSPLGVGGRV